MTDIKRVSASFSRPANTIAYAANDAVSDDATTPTAMTFSDCAYRNGRGGYIQGLKIIDSAYTAPGSPGGLAGELLIFTVAPAAAGFDDNSAAAITDAELANLIAHLPFDMDNGVPGTPTAGAGGNTFLLIKDLQVPFTTASGDRDLYGVVVAANAYVPVSAETFTFELILDRENN